MSGEEALPSGGGQPSTLEELIQVLTRLPTLGPVERGPAIQVLQQATPGVLARMRADAAEEALDLPRMTVRKLAGLWGIHESNVHRLRAEHGSKQRHISDQERD